MKWSKLKGLLRLQAYLLVVGGIVTGTALARAYYAGNRLAETLSETMVAQMDLSLGSAQTLTVNGQKFAFMVSVVAEPPESVLTKAEYYCAKNSGDLEASFGDMMALPEMQEAGLNKGDASRLTTVRRDYENGEGGDVACFTRPDDDASNGGIMKRLEAFSKSFMAGELGKAHYMKATPTRDGKGTRLLTVYSEDSLNFDRMFPDSGDAAGSDPEYVARPPKSTRIFSAVMSGTQHATYVYSSTESPDVIIRSYDETMKATGWERIDYMEDPAEQKGRAYVKGNEAMFLGAEEADDGTDVSILLSGSRQVVEVNASVK